MHSIAKPLLFASTALAAYTTTWQWNDLPDKSENGQSGTNKCATSSQSSECQNIVLNSVNDFCLFGPPGTGETVGNLEREMVSYCTGSQYGTRVFPDGTIKGAHFVKTKNFIQITGTGDFTKIGVQAGDAGGELDPHGADGNGNPIGGLVFSNQFSSTGQLEQIHEWHNFMSANEFCIRACDPRDPGAWLWCPHVYDEMGCNWNDGGSYATGFDSCEAGPGNQAGVVGGSTFRQGDAHTPSGVTLGAMSNCQTYPTIVPGTATSQTPVTSATASAASSVVSASGSISRVPGSISTNSAIITNSANNNVASASTSAPVPSSSVTGAAGKSRLSLCAGLGAIAAALMMV